MMSNRRARIITKLKAEHDARVMAARWRKAFDTMMVRTFVIAPDNDVIEGWDD